MIPTEQWRCKLCGKHGDGKLEFKRHMEIFHSDIEEEERRTKEDNDALNTVGPLMVIGNILSNDEPSSEPAPNIVAGGGDFGGGGASSDFGGSDISSSNSFESNSGSSDISYGGGSND